MNQKLVRYSLALLWVVVILNVLLTPLGVHYLPSDAFGISKNYNNFIAQVPSVLFIFGLLFSSYFISKNDIRAVRSIEMSLCLLFFSLLIFCFYNFQPYVYYSSLIETGLMILGMLYVYCNASINNKKYDIVNIRITSILLIASCLIPSYIPSFSNHLLDDHTFSVFRLNIDIPKIIQSYVIWLGLLGLFTINFKSVIGKICFPFLFIIILQNYFNLNVSSPLFVILDYSSTYFFGYIIGLLYFSEAANDFKNGFFSRMFLYTLLP